MANTRITQGVIKPNEDYDVRHINATGVITATNLNLSGVLTYEDVTNVDSIGIITAREGVVSLGVVTATAFHGDGSNLTGVDSTALKDPAGNVKVQAQASGAVHTGISTFDTINVGSGVTIESNGQATFTGIVTFGSNSTTIGDNVINVGTALTLGHSQGLQFHTQNLHADGFEINNINASGIITAAQFSGDGSNLANLPAGLGTALSSTQSSPLNKIYYTNTVLPVESTVTVDTPASASAAYTQYADISVGTGADLIISDGDDLIPDVLGLRPDGTFGGGALGRMRVDKLVGKDANSAVNVEKGLVVTGVTTSTTFSGSGASLTNLNASNIASGTVPTARLGSGTANSSTFLAGDSTFKTVTGTTINNNADNRVITGSGTANTLNGESGLVYNGYNLAISGTGQQQLNIGSTNAGGVAIILDGDSNGDAAGGDYSIIRHNTDGDLEFFARGPAGATNTIFRQGTSEKVRIDAGGNMNITGIVTATAFISSQGALTNRNKIINGDFTIHQRGGTIASGSGVYTLDRWRTYRSGSSSGGFSVQQSTGSYPQTNISGVIDNFKASAFITVTSAGSADTNNNCKFQQRIEGSNVYDLAFGTVAAKKVTVSFYVKCSLTGDFGIALVNENHNRSNVQLYTVNSATTWERKIVTFNGDTSGTWTFGTGTGLQLMFDMGSGSSKHAGSLNTWLSGEYHGTTSSVKLIHTNGATIQFTGVQLEAGEVATPFEFRSYADELQRCERYYQKYGDQRMMWMTNVNGTDHRKIISFPTTMRATPSMNLYDQSVDGSSVSAEYVTTKGYGCKLNGNGRHAAWKHEANAEL